MTKRMTCNFTLSEKSNLPKSLSEILQQLIHNDFKSDNINVTSVQSKSENGSNIFYIKAKPNVDGKVKPNNLSNISFAQENEYEENFKDVYKFNDMRILKAKTHKEEVQSDNDNSTVKIDYVPKSMEYIIQSDNTVTKEGTGKNNDNDNLLLENENINYPDIIINKAYFGNADKTAEEYEDTNNVLELRNNPDKSDYNKFNVLKLNETFEKLFKEVNEIKTLYENDKIPTKATVKIAPLATRRFDTSNHKPIALLPYYNFIMRNVNVMPPMNQNFFRNPYRKKYIINSLTPTKRVKLLRNYLIRPPLLCCEHHATKNKEQSILF
ncbi:unnamed protein product, partial [Brenthis ino]